MSTMKTWLKKAFTDVQSVLCYLGTVGGVVLAPYLPMLKSPDPISVHIQWIRIILAAIPAVGVIAAHETRGGTDAASQAAKSQRFVLRFITAVLLGAGVGATGA